MHEQPTTWIDKRRWRNRANATTATSAIALCMRHLSAGSLTRASRAALLAQRLMRLEVEQAERKRKQEIKRAIERARAEAALEEARKAIESLNAPPRQRYEPLSDGELQRMLASASADTNPIRDRNPTIDALPVQFSAPDSC